MPEETMDYRDFSADEVKQEYESRGLSGATNKEDRIAELEALDRGDAPVETPEVEDVTAEAESAAAALAGVDAMGVADKTHVHSTETVPTIPSDQFKIDTVPYPVYKSAKYSEAQAQAAADRLDQTVRGGRYTVAGIEVNANGEAL